MKGAGGWWRLAQALASQVVLLEGWDANLANKKMHFISLLLFFLTLFFWEAGQGFKRDSDTV